MLKRIFGLCLLYVICISNGYARSVVVYFTPSNSCENQIIHFIDTAQNTIDAAVYAINNEAIVEALLRAHKRGVHVRILTDRVQAGQKSSKVPELEAAGIPLIRHTRYRIQHDKFAVFDGKKAVTGSYNWTDSASRKNAENCLFFKRFNKTVNDYSKRFNELWQLNLKKQKKQ